MSIDTHAHLEDKRFDFDFREVFNRAQSAGVEQLINVSSDFSTCGKTLALAEVNPQIYAAIGVHPHFSGFVTQEEIKHIEGFLQKDRVAAVGEIGLDYYRNISSPEKQRGIFDHFVKLAKTHNLPVIIHNRDAAGDVLKVLDKYEMKLQKVIMHCFQQDKDFLTECIKRGFYISYAGNITFKNTDALKDVVRITPMEKMLVETDSPYLAPVPYRGKRNEPAYLKYTIEEIARLKNLSFADVERITTYNAETVFNIGEHASVGAVAYAIRGSLYLNITNRCTNNCSFCVRNKTYFVKGHNLKLLNEPGVDEIITAIGDPKQYQEIVFCGLGEPLLRLDVVKKVAQKLKEYNLYVRLNTNGHGNLIHQRNIPEELKGIIDEVSVSLNSHDRDVYNKLCNPRFGESTFEQVLEFIKECKKHIPKVSITAVDLPEVDIEKCRQMADSLGVGFRRRRYDEVG
ncbi:MAG: YchF/TatD family DNA exonuclease [Candidatus Omnitrophota bacterium]